MELFCNCSILLGIFYTMAKIVNDHKPDVIAGLTAIAMILTIWNRVMSLRREYRYKKAEKDGNQQNSDH